MPGEGVDTVLLIDSAKNIAWVGKKCKLNLLDGKILFTNCGVASYLAA